MKLLIQENEDNKKYLFLIDSMDALIKRSDLEKELDEADKKVQEVEDKLNEQVRQILATGGGRLQVSQADIKKLEDSQAAEEAAQDKARTTIRGKKRELREEINALKFRIKWANILIMPALVAIFGLLVAIARHRRTAA